VTAGAVLEVARVPGTPHGVENPADGSQIMFGEGTVAATAVALVTLAFCGFVITTIVTIVGRHGDAGQ
jgi:hypothetical protein